jgi:hypothetical protein
MVRDIDAGFTSLLLEVILQDLQQFGIDQIRVLWQLGMQDPVDQFQFRQWVLRDIAHRGLFLAATGIETGWQLALSTLAEQKTQHMLFDDLQTARVRRAQPILIQDRGQALQPLLPAFFGDIFVNPLSQVAGVRRAVQTFGL